MEKMLETSLQQLRVEQNMRKEAEERSKSFESKLSEWAVKFDEAEAEYRKEIADKDEKIINLEASIEFLQHSLIQKEEELTRKENIIKKLRDTFNTRTHGTNTTKASLAKVCDYEQRLTNLLQEGKEISSSPTKSNSQETTLEKEQKIIKVEESEAEANLTTLDSFEKMLTDLISTDDDNNSDKNRNEKKARKRVAAEVVPDPLVITPEAEAKKRRLDENSFEEAFHGFEAEKIEPMLELVKERISTDEIVIDGEAPETQSWHEEDIIDEKDDTDSQTLPVESEIVGLQVESEKAKVKHKTYCRVCTEEFQNKHLLLLHEKTSGHDLKYECSQCDKRFKQRIQVKRHEAQVHSDEMPFQCQLCPRRFKSEFSWKRHQENKEIHEKLANYTPFLSCEVCGKQFERRRKWCLDQHMLTHEEGNRFPCNICGKYLRTQGYLNQHMKACSGLKEEECAYCGKKFSKKTVLRNHETLHTREKPYHCRICDEKFRTHQNYREHGMKIHGATSSSHFNTLQNQAESESLEKRLNQTM